MEEKEIKTNFAKNLIYYRKKLGLTQLQLANKLNYSDKAISKWENGDTLPDIVVFSCIADFFKISVNDLIKKPTVDEDKTIVSTKSRALIIILACGLVWLACTIVFFALFMFTSLDRLWLTFILAIPATFIVLVVFSSLWYKEIFQCISTSGLIWSVALSISLCFFRYSSSWFIYIVAGILQILFILWYLFRYLHFRKSKTL